MADIFLSYSRDDITLVRGLVSALGDSGLSVWWDQNILFGDWSDQLEQALDEASRVIVVLTPNAVKAKRGYILAEMGRAHEQKKLLPLKVGEFPIPLIYEGLIVRNQTYYFADTDELLTAAAIGRICAACGAAPSDSRPDEEGVARWIQSGIGIEQLALALAVAAFEQTPLSLVTEAASSLEHRLRGILHKDAIPSPSFDPASILMPRSSRLNQIRALCYREKHARLGVPVDYVRFEDPNRAFDLVDYVWDELEGIRGPFTDWLDNIAKTAIPDMRLRLGLIIGALAQSQFATVFEQVIGRWALSEDAGQRAVADVSLAIAVVERSAGKAVRRIVLDWAVSRSAAQRRAAIELSCGYTGSRLPNNHQSSLPNLTIEVLKRIDKARNIDPQLLSTMRDGIDFFVRSSRDSVDNSLFDLEGLVSELCTWVTKTDGGGAPRLPLFLFLRIMSQLPLRQPPAVSGTLSLDRLVSRDETLTPTAMVFHAALRDVGTLLFQPRQAVREILQRWCKTILDDRATLSETKQPVQVLGPIEPDPLLILAQSIYRLPNNTERDRKRLAYAVRRAYSEHEL